jgi:hypothetical protein
MGDAALVRHRDLADQHQQRQPGQPLERFADSALRCPYRLRTGPKDRGPGATFSGTSNDSDPSPAKTMSMGYSSYFLILQ